MRCASCGAVNQALNAFCGMCGVAITHPAEMSTLQVATPNRYRGPRRLMISGAVALTIGSPVAVASFSTVQGKGVSGFVLDIAVPAINLGLESAGLTRIQGAVGGDGASMLLVAAFVAGSILAAFGAWLLLSGGIWMLVRSSLLARSEKAYRHAQPVASHIAHQSGQQISAAVTTGAQHGRRYWRKTTPKINSVTRRGKRWVGSRVFEPRISRRTTEQPAPDGNGHGDPDLR